MGEGQTRGMQRGTIQADANAPSARTRACAAVDSGITSHCSGSCYLVNQVEGFAPGNHCTLMVFTQFGARIMLGGALQLEVHVVDLIRPVLAQQTCAVEPMCFYLQAPARGISI